MGEHTFNQNKWQWHELDLTNEQKLQELISQTKKCEQWVEHTLSKKSINLGLHIADEGKEAIWGSIVYIQDIEEKEKQHTFHFYLTNEFLITGYLDFSLLDDSSEEDLLKRLDRVESPIEGLLVILNEIISSFLIQIGHFEQRINDLLWEVKAKNGKAILEKIADCRHELLVWKNLAVPVREIIIALEEAFGEEIKDSIQFKRTELRLQRTKTLLHEYEQEIESMVNLENVVASLRGNEIMKTLTVLTTLFTPVMAWGALWGMNFKHMPELKWQFGYLISVVLIVINTLALYVYLKKKGWMGDILRARKKNSFF